MFRNAILSGVFISLGAITYLQIGGIIGAILFSFGLISIIHYKMPLFTGTAGFVKSKSDIKNLIVILLGNIVGCSLMALLTHLALPSLTASAIVIKRLNTSIISNFILSVFCGIIMTTVVKFARDNKFLPLLFGIPLFISCGFIHSIADAFYFALSFNPQLLILYPIIVLGNFIGCNLYKLCTTEK